MNYNERDLKEALKKSVPVYYFYSTEEAQVRSAAAKVLSVFRKDDPEITTLPGPKPEIEEILLAAGTISFFGTKRLVELPMLRPSLYTKSEFNDFCDILRSMDNAVFVITTVVEENYGKPKLSANEKNLAKVCEEFGYSAMILKPRPSDLIKEIQSRAQQQGATISPQTARTMLDRSGEDQLLLKNETDKLCALADYGEVTAEMVDQLGTRSLEADAFTIINLLEKRNLPEALRQLDILLQMQTAPLMITGALTSSYMRMYLLTCGRRKRKDPQAVAADVKEKEFMISKMNNISNKLTIRQQRRYLEILLELDDSLKGGSPVDGTVMLQSALCRLAQVGNEA